MISPIVADTNAYGPDRGIAEYGIPGDFAGSVGTSGIHFNLNWTDYLLMAGLPVEMGGANGAFYLSAIHSGVGSDNPALLAAQTAPPATNIPVNRPAFSNPEVTGFFTSGPNLNSNTLNGFRNTEKRLRQSSDGTAPQLGTVWIPTRGKSRLSFSLWARSSNPATNFQLEVYRDLNVADKVAARFSPALAMPFNAQLIYQFGPFMPIAPAAAGNSADVLPNAQSTFPIELGAGCNIYLVLRDAAGAGNTNFLAGSVRLV